MNNGPELAATGRGTPAARPAGDAPDLAGLEPIERIRRRWPVLLGAALSALMIVGLVRELFDGGLAGLDPAVPDSALFYLFFALAYFAPPGFDFLIYRGLWRLPFDGFGALVRKRIANDVVFGYSGDVFFYAWARARMKMVAAPFGAVKDVTILSGVAGNAITLAMLAVVLPLAVDLLSAQQFRTVLWSAAVMLALSLPVLLFSKRVFSLPRPALWRVFLLHCVRIAFGSAALALAWHFAMPNVSVLLWMFLAAGRLLFARLPLLPNKDLLFANFAIIFIGHGAALSDLIAFAAALTLAAHVALMAAFGLLAMVRKQR